MAENQAQEEIDLRFLYRKIKDFFSSVWQFLFSCFTIALKRWILILCFIIISSSIGIGLYFYMKPVYTATLIVSSNSLSNDFCSDMIHNLEIMIEDRTPELLAKNLKIDLSYAKEIKELQFDNYDEKLKKIYKDKDTVVLGRPFKIKAYAFTNNVFDTLQHALVRYMENNEYALKRKQIKIANLNLLREKYKNDIHQLDSLKLVVASNLVPRGAAQGFVFGQPIDPMNMFKEEVNMFKEELSVRKELELSDNIQVIQDFSPKQKPDYPRLKKNIPWGGAMGLIAGLIFAFYLERKKIKLASA